MSDRHAKDMYAPTTYELKRRIVELEDRYETLQADLDYVKKLLKESR